MHALQMPLSNTHHAGLGKAVHAPKFIILAWAGLGIQEPNCSVFWFGSCLEHPELELAQPISYTDMFYSCFIEMLLLEETVFNWL